MKWTFIAASLLTAGVVHAESGSTGAAFLEIPVGGAPAALGAAYTALATDAYAPHWNPAGLGALSGTQVAAQHLSYLESMNYEQVSAVHALRPGRAVGLSVQYLGSGDIPSYDPGGVRLGDYSSHFAAYSLAYGHALSDRWALGVTHKWIEARLNDVHAGAYAADLGLWFRPQERLNLGVVVANLGTKLKFLDQSDELPLAARLGAAYRVSRALLVTAEGAYHKEADPSAHGGIEWSPVTSLALRAGYRSDTVRELSALAGFSTGVGVRAWNHEFAYAWLPYGDLGDTHTFSLVLRFNSPETTRNLSRKDSL